ncbi:MAG: hypothetical protein IJM54_03575 [Thermoguttaceae bacterium]|nr:hypothetical protein [Thermoguttaceae bacterium]
MIEQLLTIEFTDEARRWATLLFFWSGYAAWIGLIVQTIFPSRDFHKPWPAFCLGWVGVALGPLIVCPFLKTGRFDPVSPSGIGVALAFSFAAFVLYHVFSFLFFKRDDEYDDQDDPYDEMSLQDLKRELRRRDQNFYSRGDYRDSRRGR